MSHSVPVSDHGIHRVTAPSALESGEPFAVSGYPTMCLNQVKSAASGDPVSGVSVGTRSFSKASGTTAASGADAFWDTVNKLVVTAAGANIISLGKFRGAAASGSTTCNVELNGA